MVKLKHVLMAGVAVLVAVVACYFLFQTDTAKIKKQFKALSTNFTKEPVETKLATGIKVKNIKALFAESILLEIPSYSISRTYVRKDIPSLVMTGRMQFKKISLKFYDITVEFPESGLAVVRLTARLIGNLNTGELVDEIHELECSVRKNEDNWLFSSIKAIEVLEK